MSKDSLKKVLVIAGGTYISGAEKITLSVLEGFKKSGYNIHCMVSGWNNGDFINRVEKLELPYTAIKLGWYYISKIAWSLDSLVHYPKAILDFLKLKNRFKADIVYTISFRQIVLLYPLFRNNIVYHIHDPHSHSKQAKFFIKLIDKKVKKYIAVSEFIKNDLINCGIRAEKIEVIYNGIEILPLSDKDYIGVDVFNIGIVGQVIHRKGHLIAVDALHKLVQQNLNVQLIIVGVGDTSFEKEVREKIEKLNLQDKVVWKGFVKDTYKIYEELDVVIAPTLNEEPFGLMACEANMLSIPAIVSNKGGLPEIVEDDFNGYTFNAENADELASKMLLLYNDRAKAVQFGLNGREKVSHLFSIEQMNSSIAALMSDVYKKNTF